jgi:hypothetical protein
MAYDRSPFADVRPLDGGFSIPEIKWRELVFIGAVRPDGELWCRDPARPMPPFENENLFPEERTFRIAKLARRVEVRFEGPETAS